MDIVKYARGLTTHNTGIYEAMSQNLRFITKYDIHIKNREG